ncbi:MAG TPA: bifunctional diaminohydroxyphosphoribosylaminopyrimidine deaminase/5-amino-6-(5-phosphoribosylamino)uracil reductase RibD, partial [Thermomicrobiaceae bacterium]|nr:bifunctional diaminohydroxyphosphoribosylaminopyrimidine deaminase/5-amino-6-(5-phosphoribosylamino)uracil reductase RibD [Thermomicrobiaceae bacterium]
SRAGSVTTGRADIDQTMMGLALEQARTARGRVAPNPAVGAVVARNGDVIAVGATQPPPGPHAEVVALAAAGNAATGADLYVTLEPCAHHGRTPPCTDAIVAAGITRVVVAVIDPNPIVHWRGVAQLQAAGIRVEIGAAADSAAEVIAGFTKRVVTGRPLVTAKYAMTLDGRIATRTGHARWISGAASREHAHRIRDRVDAILVGVGTVLADDPLLTTRIPPERAGSGGPHHPLRVILDTAARMPSSARMLSPETPGSTLVVVGPDASSTRVEALQRTDTNVVHLPVSDGRIDPSAVLDLLGELGINDLLIEGGRRIHGAFFDAHLVDCVSVYIGPSIVGGLDAPAPVGGRGVAVMPAAARVVDQRLTALGDDLHLEGRVVYPERPAHV